MADPDPETLLEWLSSGLGDERDMQLIALEQLCMLLLMSDNVDRCFESCPPRTFLPALCRIFLDEQAPENVLEVTARAITYYLDVSAECTRRIVAMDGAVRAICNRLVVAELSSRTSKDLAEQCVKVGLEKMNIFSYVLLISYKPRYVVDTHCYVNFNLRSISICSLP